MAFLVRVRITCYVDAAGKRVPKGTPGAKKLNGKSAKWYGKGIPGLDPKKRVPLAADKRAAEAMLADLVRQAERRQANPGMQDLEHARRPLAQHLADFEANLRAKGDTAKQVKDKTNRIRRIFAGCDFVWMGELSASKVQHYLAGLRESPPPPDLPAEAEWFTKRQLADVLGIEPCTVNAHVRRHGLAAEGNGKRRRFPRATAEALRQLVGRGMGPQTVNHYVEAIKSFGKWLVDDNRLEKNPLGSLVRLNVDTDVRRGRRALDAEELGRLLGAAGQGAKAVQGLAGPDRRMLYLTACGTGFREGELAALLPEWFDLADAGPAVTLPAREGKNRKPIVQPLPQDVARELRGYLADKPADAAVWPGRWAERGAEMLRADLEAAGIPYVVQSPDGPLYADFHSLRHSFVALLDKSGASLKQAMQLARHSDPKLTMKRYGRAQAHELAQAVDRLPLLNGCSQRGLLADLPREQLEALALAGVVALALVDTLFNRPAAPETPPPPRPARKGKTRPAK